MRNRISGALAFACALFLPALAIAQVVIDAPRGTAVAATGVAYGARDSTATFVDATHGLPSLVLPTSNAVISFQQTCTTSAVALTSAVYSNGFVITALTSNTGTAYIGGSGVTTSAGYPLKPGQSIAYGAANASQAYLICDGTTDKIAVTGN